jgi:hypothetical protein
MNKINLKNGGFVYIEPKNDVEEDDIIKFYDENMCFVNYFYIDNYDENIKYWENLESPLDYFVMCFRQVFHGKTLNELFINMSKYYNMYMTQDEIEKDLQELHKELELKGEREFCANHLINKIGGYYIYYED